MWVVILGLVSECPADDIAVSFNISTSEMATPSGGSNHGWQFTANNPIKVTHLGLYDEWPDGFTINHPIGLWRLNDGTLLASGTIIAGTINPLIDHFRYVDVPDVQLSVGVNYVVGYYSAQTVDDQVCKAGGLQVNPAINLVVGRNDGAGQFQMPANINTPNPPEPFYPDDFGPNFLFEVPEPMTLLLFGLGSLILRNRHGK